MHFSGNNQYIIPYFIGIPHSQAEWSTYTYSQFVSSGYYLLSWEGDMQRFFLNPISGDDVSPI